MLLIIITFLALTAHVGCRNNSFHEPTSGTGHLCQLRNYRYCIGRGVIVERSLAKSIALLQQGLIVDCLICEQLWFVYYRTAAQSLLVLSQQSLRRKAPRGERRNPRKLTSHPCLVCLLVPSVKTPFSMICSTACESSVCVLKQYRHIQYSSCKLFQLFLTLNTFAAPPEISQAENMSHTAQPTISQVNRHDNRTYSQPILVAMATSLTSVIRN